MTIADCFSSMDYAPVPASTVAAREWLARHAPATGTTSETLATTLAAARQAQSAWQALKGSERASILRAWAAALENQATDLAILECLESGQLLRTALRRDLPLAIAYLRQGAVNARRQVPATTKPAQDAVSVILSAQSPLLRAAQAASAALATGCAVVLQPPAAVASAVRWLVELATTAGIPPDLLAVLTHTDPAPARATRLAFVVFDTADLNAAADSITETALTGSLWAPTNLRLLAQEGVSEALQHEVRRRFETARAGNALDNVADWIGQAGASPTVPDWVTDALTFRTPDEAAMLASHARSDGLAVSLWASQSARVLSMARQIPARVVWVNGAERFDPAAMPDETEAMSDAPPGPGPNAALRLRPPAASSNGGGRAAIAAVHAAVQAARKAHPAWQDLGVDSRAARLWAVADYVRHHSARFAALSPEDLASAASRLEEWAAMARDLDGTSCLRASRELVIRLRDPLGVVGLVGAATGSSLEWLCAAAPALLAGNTVVLVGTPAPLATDASLQDVLAAAAVPAGVLGHVPGERASLAEGLLHHGEVDAVFKIEAGTGLDLLQVTRSKTLWLPCID